MDGRGIKEENELISDQILLISITLDKCIFITKVFKNKKKHFFYNTRVFNLISSFLGA